MSTTRIRVLAAIGATLTLFAIIVLATNGFGTLNNEHRAPVQNRASVLDDPYAIEPIEGDDLMVQLAGNLYSSPVSQDVFSSDNGRQSRREWNRDGQDLTIVTIDRQLDSIITKLAHGQKFWCDMSTNRLELIIPAFRWARSNIADDGDFIATTGYPSKNFTTTVEGVTVEGVCYRGRSS